MVLAPPFFTSVVRSSSGIISVGRKAPATGSMVRTVTAFASVVYNHTWHQICGSHVTNVPFCGCTTTDIPIPWLSRHCTAVPWLSRHDTLFRGCHATGVFVTTHPAPPPPCTAPSCRRHNPPAVRTGFCRRWDTIARKLPSPSRTLTLQVARNFPQFMALTCG